MGRGSDPEETDPEGTRHIQKHPEGTHPDRADPEGTSSIQTHPEGTPPDGADPDGTCSIQKHPEGTHPDEAPWLLRCTRHDMDCDATRFASINHSGAGSHESGPCGSPLR